MWKSAAMLVCLVFSAISIRLELDTETEVYSSFKQFTIMKYVYIFLFFFYFCYLSNFIIFATQNDI